MRSRRGRKTTRMAGAAWEKDIESLFPGGGHAAGEQPNSSGAPLRSRPGDERWRTPAPRPAERRGRAGNVFATFANFPLDFRSLLDVSFRLYP